MPASWPSDSPCARQSGTFTVLDVATPGRGNYLEPLKIVLPETDLFVPNADEAELILGERDPVRQAMAFHELGAHRVVITRGERGSFRYRRTIASSSAPTPCRSSTAREAETRSTPATSRACSKGDRSSTASNSPAPWRELRALGRHDGGRLHARGSRELHQAPPARTRVDRLKSSEPASAKKRVTDD